MAELEIHHESEHGHDPLGQKVGVLAALLAVALAVVTIASHRTHTAAIMHQSNANDDWAHYQSVRVKYHNLELGSDLIHILGVKNVESAATLVAYQKQMKDYEAQGKDIQAEAKRAGDEAEADEKRALHFDFGEGLLEIGLVLSSLYFISKKKMFPVMGIIAGGVGVVVAAIGAIV